MAGHDLFRRPPGRLGNTFYVMSPACYSPFRSDADVIALAHSRVPMVFRLCSCDCLHSSPWTEATGCRTPPTCNRRVAAHAVASAPRLSKRNSRNGFKRLPRVCARSFVPASSYGARLAPGHQARLRSRSILPFRPVPTPPSARRLISES
jgi:hypothetical protein